MKKLLLIGLVILTTNLFSQTVIKQYKSEVTYQENNDRKNYNLIITVEFTENDTNIDNIKIIKIGEQNFYILKDFSLYTIDDGYYIYTNKISYKDAIWNMILSKKNNLMIFTIEVGKNKYLHLKIE